ncbi:hypothetical protein BpHYR1_016567 [Brachionus plicatilis]|uniref:Uncharacterized protein n=1 Tax=Brachionus plicatilis TaxID=10195 RepID=A0A3M7QLW2_BRAPC|nr:hypothetical protein BpHYR1_016567 [Brachionus plicatilis]
MDNFFDHNSYSNQYLFEIFKNPLTKIRRKESKDLQKFTIIIFKCFILILEKLRKLKFIYFEIYLYLTKKKEKNEMNHHKTIIKKAKIQNILIEKITIIRIVFDCPLAKTSKKACEELTKYFCEKSSDKNKVWTHRPKECQTLLFNCGVYQNIWFEKIL